MGMDVYGKKPRSKTGEYFRNNVWWWRPLADYCCTRAPGLTAKCESWQTNDGDGLNDRDARTLMQVLARDIRTGYAKRYAERYMAELEALPDKECWLCGGTGKRNDMKVANGCNGCGGKGTVRPDEASYPFSEENVREFVAFLKDCGGFEIK